jgi:hypothetical protein
MGNINQQLEEGRLISVYEDDFEMLTAINRIFLEDKGFDLDPTYSQGVFYKKFGFQEPREKSDLVSLSPEVKQMDCRKLNYPKDWFNSISKGFYEDIIAKQDLSDIILQRKVFKEGSYATLTVCWIDRQSNEIFTSSIECKWSDHINNQLVKYIEGIGASQ